MSTTTLAAKITLRYDSYENWIDESKEAQGANLVLLPGEIGLCEIPGATKTVIDGDETIDITTAPTLLFKVGGIEGKPFKELPWASAKAADVYSWAKTATKPEYTAEEVGALPNTTVIPSIDGLASEEYVDEKVKDVEVSLEALATNVGLNAENIEKLNTKDNEQGTTIVQIQEDLDGKVASLKNNTYGGWEVYAISPHTADKARTDTIMTVGTNPNGFASGKLASYFPNSSGSTSPTPNGRLVQADPVHPYQVANKNYVDAVGDRVSLLEQQNQMMSQVIQPVEDTYLSKSFTQKMSIFDNYGMGGKSKLLSIEGNTEACKNLLNPATLRAGDIVLTPEIVDNGNVIKVTVGNVNHMVLFYSLGVLPAGNYTFSCGGVSTNKVHPNSPNEKYAVISYINNGPDRQYIMPETRLYPAQYTFQANGVNTVEVAFKRCTTDIDEIITITRPQLERNDYKTDFVPYYVGWRSPIITGIQSKSIFKNSEQIVNNYFNSEYECEFGVIFDFENKKIIKKYVDVWLTGEEEWHWAFSNDTARYQHCYMDNLPYKDALILSTIQYNKKLDLSKLYESDYCYADSNSASGNIFAINFLDTTMYTTDVWKAHLNQNPLLVRFLTDEVISEEPLNENDIITTFNQCTQKPIYSADQDILNKIPLKIKQEVVLTNQRESTTPLKPITPASTSANLVEGSGGDYGIHTYTFSGNGDFVYNEPIILDYNEKLVAEFAINPTSSNYLNGDGWLAITLGNIPPANMVSYPQISYNMVTYSSMRQVIWGSTAVNGKTSYKTGLSEIYPNEFGNSNLDSYYYKVEVTRVGLNLYNYRLSRLRKGVENSYEVIDEVQDIKTNENSAGIPSYYVQSIMIAGLGHTLTLGGLRFYKAQL